MFFPTSSEIIKRRFSRKEIEKTKKNTKTDVDWSWTAITRTSLSKANINSGSNPKETKTEPIQIVIGEKLKFGVERFLSNNGKTTHLVRFKKGVSLDEPVDLDSLEGKYLLICCFDLPMPSDSFVAMKCRALIAAYHELSERGYPFETVVVANLRTDVVYDPKAAFYHFYSAFSCLAIPFSDFETRDYIHSCMTRSLNRFRKLAILVDPEGFILQDETALTHFLHYGSEWAPPFLPTTLDAIKKQDEVLKSKLDPMYSKIAIDENDTVDDHPQPPLSLYRDILHCDPCLTLGRFDAAAETDVEVFSTVLDLSRKCVALYLFIDGEIMEDIKAAHDHCLANNQQLEIVLVPMPCFDEPESHIKQLHQALRSLKIKSWFLYNCQTEDRRRLWRIFGREPLHPGERFIIIPPFCKSGELCGREIITNFGVDQYPFTRTAVLKQKLEYIRSLTPFFSSSLFNNRLMIQKGECYKSEQLQGKNVLLYLTWSECDHYSLMKNHYPEIKAMGWEVVLVLLDYTHRYWNKRWVDPVVCQKCPCLKLYKMPWPVMLLPAATRTEIKDKLFFPEDRKTFYLFAVGKDGKIVSRDVQRRLNTDGVTESLFDDVLEADLARGLARITSLDDYN